MGKKIIAWVIRRGDKLHLVLLQKSGNRDILKFFVGGVEDAVGALRIKRFKDAEHLLKLHLRPVVERVPRELGKDGRRRHGTFRARELRP